jgi:phosphopentomutase
LNNFFIIVLDGVGVGELPDASRYNDQGSNTLKNLSAAVKKLHLPHLQSMGLGNICSIQGVPPVKISSASYGMAAEISPGKDSTTGHWEMGGLYVDTDFTYYPDGFPEELMNKFLQLTGLKGYLGNIAASGTEIIQLLGDKHLETGYPIIYTSADSVFQIAAHEEIIHLSELYRICKITREKIIEPPHIIGRVIARPFLGKNGKYTRTANRKDFSLDPPAVTILDLLLKNGIPTIAIGKINDLFNHRGIKTAEPTKSNKHGCELLIKYAEQAENSFIFTNLVDFDVQYGHRNDPEGFASELMVFDNFLAEFLPLLDDSDALIITSDHGNDPTTPSTDHSREYVPVLFYRKNKIGHNLGIRKTFADISKTAAEYFNVVNDLRGQSFLNE